MNENRIKGALKKAKGAVKDATSKWSGRPGTKAKGKAEKAEGEIQSQVGKAQDADSSS